MPKFLDLFDLSLPFVSVVCKCYQRIDDYSLMKSRQNWKSICSIWGWITNNLTLQLRNPHGDCYWTKRIHSKYHPMISSVFAWDLFHCWIEFFHTLKQCYQLSTEYSIEITYLSKNIWVQLNWSQDHLVSFPSGNVSTADSSLSAQQLGNGDWLLLLLRYAEGQHFHFSIVH